MKTLHDKIFLLLILILFVCCCGIGLNIAIIKKNITMHEAIIDATKYVKPPVDAWKQQLELKNKRK